MNRSAQARRDNRQDKERDEGDDLASLRCHDRRPNPQQADQNNSQNDDGSDCVVSQSRFPSGVISCAPMD